MGSIIDGIDMDWADGWLEVPAEASRRSWAKAQAKSYRTDRAARKLLEFWLGVAQNLAVSNLAKHSALTFVWVPDPTSGRFRAVMSLSIVAMRDGGSPETSVAADGEAEEAWQGSTDAGVPYFATLDRNTDLEVFSADVSCYWLFPAESRTYAKLIIQEIRDPSTGLSTRGGHPFDEMIRTAVLTLIPGEGAQEA